MILKSLRRLLHLPHLHTQVTRQLFNPLRGPAGGGAPYRKNDWILPIDFICRSEKSRLIGSSAPASASGSAGLSGASPNAVCDLLESGVPPASDSFCGSGQIQL